MKKTVLHIIDYLGYGGAEAMLVKVLKELKEYNNIVVTLNPQNHFGDEFSCDTYYCLHMGSFARFPFAITKLKKIFRENKVDLVHSHLFTATLVARLATPANIPLVTTIHTNVSTSNDYKKWYIKLLEGISYRFHRSSIIAVSQNVMEQYFAFLHHKPYKKHLLYTFVDVERLQVQPNPVPEIQKGVFTLAAIGALRYPKNQQYLIRAFEKLKGENFELHIYGDGVLRPQMEQAIAASGVRVKLMGEVKHASGLLPQYNLYVMPSEFEGFSLSVLEAMAMQVPMLLSDIPSFREQCSDTAMYFDLNDVNDFLAKLRRIAADKQLQTDLASAARERVYNNFTLTHHMEGLRNIYADTLNDAN